MNIQIEQAELSDLSEILSLQKLAYRSEAEIHDDFSIPPLHQTLEEIEKEFEEQLFLKVIVQGKIIASVRAYEKDGTCFVGKLIVDPSCQNQGIGKKIMAEIEERYNHAERFELFTGHKSEKNLYLYKKLGYNTFKEERISDKLTLIYLEKRADTHL